MGTQLQKNESHARPPTRRGFLVKVTALITGAAAGLIPALSGLVVVLHPLLRKGRSGGKVFVASLQALPSDGVPRKFNVVADRVNAWNTSKNVPVGAVYLRRTGPAEVTALNVVCPHAGCFVNLAPTREEFVCPCHNSSFRLDGSISSPNSPSPRAMDRLEVEIRNDNEIWVLFQNFQAGHEEKIPLA